jgi:hypothetical protein
VTDPTAVALAADAYVYGFPLVFDLSEVDRSTREGMGAMSPSTYNAFTHADALAGPDDTFVSINNDTLYSIAQLDLGDGPLWLDVPDTQGRYYVLQFVDAWTNNFAYVGRRATGTAAARFLLVGPGWRGEAPAGATVIRVPTRVATIVGRVACDGPDDLGAVAEVQRGLVLTPLRPGGAPSGVPPVPDAGGEARTFFTRMRTWMEAFPPSAPELALQERFAGIDELDDAMLEAGLAAGQERIETVVRRGDLGAPVNGWVGLVHIFDYNADHLELGTIDAPEWKIADRRHAHLVRAVAAREGLWGNHAYEAFYAGCYVDDAGEPLTGERRYEIRFETEPPVDAFWSLTMYDTPDYYLVRNPIGRYSIGDRTPGLARGEDGTLTLTLQREEPADPAARANWLPTPAGGFRPLVRLYEPRAAVLDGSYRLPPIRRID